MTGAVYALDAYVVLQKLGEGVFGEVFKCLHKETGNIVAVKHIKAGASAMLQELTALNALDSLDPDTNNLINLNNWFQSKNEDYFMEFEMLDQSVFDLKTKRNSSFSLSEIRPMAREMLVALNGLRTVGVIHTDIKPDNIMLVDHKNKPFKVKLIDFGVAILRKEAEIGEILQPPAYRSPEVTLGLPITEAIDMWSLACCLLEWYLNIYPFNVEDSYDSLRQITHLLGVPDGYLIMQAEEGTSFFVQEKSGKWRLKTRDEYRDPDGKIPKLERNFLEAATGLDDAVLNSFEIQSGMEYEDRKAFLDLLKKMFEFDPDIRITPAEALEHPFITLSHFRDALNYVADSGKLLAFTPCYDPIAEEPTRQKRFNINLLLPSIVSSSDTFSSTSDSLSYEDSASANSNSQSSHSSSMNDYLAPQSIFQPFKALNRTQDGGFMVHYAKWRKKKRSVVRCKGTYDAQKGKDDGSKSLVCQPSPRARKLQNHTYNTQSDFKVHYANCRNTQEKERSVVLHTGTYDAQKGKDDGSKSPVRQHSPNARKLQNSTYHVQSDFKVNYANCGNTQEKERSVVLHTGTYDAQKGKNDGSKSPVFQPLPKVRKLQNSTYNAQSDFRPILKSIDERLKSPICPSKKGKTQNCTFNAQSSGRMQTMNSSQVSSDSDGPADICSFTPERVVHVSNFRDICFCNDCTINSWEVNSETEAEEEAVIEKTGDMVIKPRTFTFNAQSKNRSEDEDFKTQKSSGTDMEESEEDCPSIIQSTHNRCFGQVGNFKVHVSEYRNQATVESQDMKVDHRVQPLGVQLPISNEISNGKLQYESLRTSTYNISNDEGSENEQARTTLCQELELTSPTISPTEYIDIQQTEQTLNVSENSCLSRTSTERPAEVLAVTEIVLGEKFLKTERTEHFMTLHNTIISNQPQNVEVTDHQPLPSQRDDDDDEKDSFVCTPLCSSLIQPVLNFICSSFFSFTGFLTSEKV